jgi:soluble lytic murein transglycosylase-like protein
VEIKRGVFMKKRAVALLIFVFSLMTAMPAMASAQSKIPVVFCGPTLYSPFIKIDCSKVESNESKIAVEVDTRKVSLSENKTLPRSASAVRTFFGGLADSIRELIKKIAKALNMDPRILEAVARAESGGNQAAISPAGAVGVMQLMPGTARELGVNPYDTEQNILGGAMYLKRQMDRFGSLPLALAAYNAGPGAVEKYGGISPYEETKRYIANVLSMIGGY